ncbi:hypothetical protein SEA_ATUIN_5 [Arthrobacter phage Atuin]|nr:hypothetical protein SEA_ATUIN_104 [Arthrobacter phage Atuin]
MKVSIYRVEERRGGAGPYNRRNTAALGDMFAEHGSCGEHVPPQKDELLLGINADEHCGFATLEQLDAWFDGFHQRLADLGFMIAHYVVPLNLVRYGKTQALFVRGDSFPVEHLQL